MKRHAAVVLGVVVCVSAVAKPPTEFCRPLSGRVVTEFTSENCHSPVALCLKGHIVGDPLLAGTTFYTTDAVGPTPVEPGIDKRIAYAGTFVLTTKRGTLTVADMGFFDRTNGLESSQSRSVAGTGIFQNVTSGAFYTFGTGSATGFDARVAGRLCFKHPDLLALD